MTEEYLGYKLDRDSLTPDQKVFYDANFEPITDLPPVPESEWVNRIQSASSVSFGTKSMTLRLESGETHEKDSTCHRTTLSKMLSVRPGLCGKSCKSDQECELLVERWKHLLK